MHVTSLKGEDYCIGQCLSFSKSLEKSECFRLEAFEINTVFNAMNH